MVFCVCLCVFFWAVLIILVGGTCIGLALSHPPCGRKKTPGCSVDGAAPDLFKQELLLSFPSLIRICVAIQTTSNSQTLLLLLNIMLSIIPHLPTPTPPQAKTRSESFIHDTHPKRASLIMIHRDEGILLDMQHCPGGGC